MVQVRRPFIVVCLLSCVTFSGCGYSLAGRGSFLPDYIRTIGVPLFVNHTPVFDVEQRITDKVRSELIGRGRYKIQPDRTGVDAVLIGEIQAVNLTVAAFDQQQQATRKLLVDLSSPALRSTSSMHTACCRCTWPHTTATQLCWIS